jgi:hypothetical protein
MAAVENETLLLYYHTIVESRLKFFFGEEAPARKMFLVVSNICVEYQKLQQRTCSQAQRSSSTTVILQKLAEIIDYIESQKIPLYVGEEAILWFDYNGEIYTLYNLSNSLIQQYIDYQASIPLFSGPSTSHPAQRRHYTVSSRETSPQPSSSNAGSRLPRHPSDIRTITFKRRSLRQSTLTTRESSRERTSNQFVVSARNRGEEYGID